MPTSHDTAVGDDTRDLPLERAKTELAIQAAGNRAVIVGIVLAVLMVLGASLYRGIFNSPLPYEWTLGVLSAAIIAVCYGLTERRDRATRATLRSVSSKLDNAVAGTTAIAARLDAMEKVVAKLPGYGEAVLDGMELASRMRAGREGSAPPQGPQS